MSSIRGTTSGRASAGEPPGLRSSFRDDRRFLLGLLAATLLLRLQCLMWPLTPDESGYLMVSRTWDPEPGSVYGFFFADRPPVLLGLFRAADGIAGQYGPRMVAVPFALLFVFAAYRVGILIGGIRAARLSAVTAVALAGQPFLSVWAAKGESFGTPLVMASCWMSLEALRTERTRARSLWAFSAGVAGALAIGMKQNLVGGVVFGLVLLVVARWSGAIERHELPRAFAAAFAGFALPVGLVVGWAAWQGVELGAMWEALYGFRADALDVIFQGSLQAPITRLIRLGLFFVLSGMALLVACFLFDLRRRFAEHPEAAAATLAVLGVDVVSLLLGGSYWLPYLTALLPGIVLAVAVSASSSAGRQWRVLRTGVGFAAVSTLIVWTGWLVGDLTDRITPVAADIGASISESASPGDTIVVLYGRPDIVRESGLRTPYEQLWSLPMRTLDPEQERLRAAIESPDAPTWVVLWNPVNSWGIDRGGKLRSLLEERYDVVADLCDREVLLRKGIERPPLEPVTCMTG